VDDTVLHELRQLACQDILFMLGQDNVEDVYRVDSSSFSSKTAGSFTLVYVLGVKGLPVVISLP